MRRTCAILLLALLGGADFLPAAEPRVPDEPAGASDAGARTRQLAEFDARLSGVLTKHLDLLLGERGSPSLKGKSADGMTALALYLTYEADGNQAYRKAAIALAEQIVQDMRATKHGVLYIKEKEKGGESIPGGGPPAMGWYTAYAAYIFHKEGGHDEDLRYIAGVLDNFPWNEKGWWASTIDVTTGIAKESLDKPSIINKTAAVALAAAMVGTYVREIDSKRSASLLEKARRCVYDQILPAQEDDGYWHYSLADNDPKNKDILGYFMVTVHALLQLQLFTDSFRDEKFQAAIDKAFAFAAKHMAPMTDPNMGPSAPEDRRTPETPDHYSREKEMKRGPALALILIAGRNYDDGIKIADYWLETFESGNRGQDGAHVAYACALMRRSLPTSGQAPALNKN